MFRITPKIRTGRRMLDVAIMMIMLVGLVVPVVAGEPVVTTFPDGWKITITPGESSRDDNDDSDPWSGLTIPNDSVGSYARSQNAIVAQQFKYAETMAKIEAANRRRYSGGYGRMTPIGRAFFTFRVRNAR